MRKFNLLFLLLLTLISLQAQDKMYLHFSNKTTLGAPISSTDSLWFSPDGSQAYFNISGSIYSYAINQIDSITFGNDSQTIGIIYENESVTLFNPMAFEGVEVTISGGDVTVNATTELQDINFNLSGSTADGSFKIYTVKRYNLFLNGLSITNPDGPAINVQSEKKTTVILVDGTINELTDGAVYVPAPNEEDQDAAFFSEAKLVFTGNGNLTINASGNDQHGLASDDEIEILGGNIAISSAVRDGIHANDGLLMTAGNIQLTASGDGIDADAGAMEVSGGSISIQLPSADVKGLSCDSTLLISGGSINIAMTGNQSKAIKSDQAMTLSGGTIVIHTSGDAVLEAAGQGFDPSYCTAIKSDDVINLSGASITITSTGKAGKGISSDAGIVMTGGIVSVTTTGNGAVYTNSLGQADAYVATCLTANGNINLLDGNLTTSSTGIAGKGLSADHTISIGSEATNPVIQVTTTGARLLVSGSGSNANYAEAKALKADVDFIMTGGSITISSSDDGIKAENAITIQNGIVNITNSKEGIEAPFITFNGGNTHVKSTDDCLNATFGGGGEQNDGSLISFNAGYVMTNSTGGDGIDSNGNMLMTGGTVVVHGPPSNPEVGLDVNGSINVNAGLLVISGPNSNMTEAPSATSAQYSLKITTSQALSATTLFHIQNAAGEDVLTFQPMRSYASIVFSSAALQNGLSYSIYTGGSCTGTPVDGLYSGGTYSGGTLRKTFTVTGKVTNVTF